MIKISVVIPAFNAMKYLPQTVESLIQQTYEEFEVIIVNDGSSDNIESWFRNSIHDPRFRLISQRNQGLSGARNTGIQNSKGDFIAFLDADDLWHPQKLEKQVMALQRSPDAGLVYTWLQFVDESAVPNGRVVKHYYEGKVWPQLTAFNFVGCGSVAMVRSDCFDAVGMFDRDLDSYVEDWDMWLRIAQNYEFALVKETLVYNRKYSGSLSTHWQKMEKSFTKVIEKAYTSAPNDSQYLKDRSYAHANLCLAWKVIQSKDKDIRAAIAFWFKALRFYPPIACNVSFLKISMILPFLIFFGADKYSAIQKAIRIARSRMVTR